MGSLVRAAETTVGPYRILDVLGQGGMGVVYRGEHLVTGRLVALKTVRSGAEIMLAGIRREIHALGRLQHPGVVQIVDQGVSAGLPWYAMELLQGRTLRSHLQEAWAHDGPDAAGPFIATHTRPLSDGSATPPVMLTNLATAPRALEAALPALLSMIRRICAPLGFLHGRGIVHRDLKPENIFIRADGSPVLVDLGIAGGFSGALGREEIAAEGKLMGSLAYMAPEQIRAELVDARADLYALGCILYECVTGRPPFAGASAESLLYQHRNVAPVPPSRHVPAIPAALEALILGLLAKRPRDRIGYADDVALALHALGHADDDPRGLPEAEPYLYRPDLAGREDALATIVGALDRTHDEQRGGCVFVGGESGVGKTRLAMEAARIAAQQGLSVIVGRCAALGDGDRGIAAAPLHPLRPLLLAVADRCRALGAAEAERLLGSRGTVLSAYEPSLAELATGTATPPGSPEAARAQVLDALAATLFAFAEARPLLLVLDDIQWADDLSLAFLRQLSTADFAGHRVILVGTYRMEERGDELAAIVRAPTVIGLELSRLDARSVGAMVSGMLALREPPPILIDFLDRRSDGNPFFVAEYLRAAILDGMLTRSREGAWRLHERGHAEGSLDASLPLPGALSGLIERRLRDLGDRGHALVQWASVLGREVDGELLTRTAGLDDAAMMEAIELLRVRQILEEPAPGQLRFVHDKIRDLAYTQIPEGERRGLHRRAAEAIEVRSADAPDAFPSLGHHFARADLPDKAGLYFTRAGDRAQAAHANGDAITFYRAAVGEAGRLPAEERIVWREPIAQIHGRLGDVLALVGRPEEARGALDDALALAPAGDPLARAMLHRGIGKTWEARHQHEDALRAYTAAEKALGPAPTGSAPAWWNAWVQIQIERISVHYWAARVDLMAPLVEKVRPIVEREATALQRARFFHVLTQMNVKRERSATSSETVGYARACLAAAEEAGDAGEIAEHTFSLAAVLLLRDEHGEPDLLDEAAERLARALLPAEHRGDVALQARCLTFLTMAHRRRRRLNETRLSGERALAVATAARITEYIAAAHANLAWAALEDGDHIGAERGGREALALWRPLALVYPFQWLALLPLAAAAFARRDLVETAEHARATLASGQQRLPAALSRALEDATMGLVQSDNEGAINNFESALALSRRFGYL